MRPVFALCFVAIVAACDAQRCVSGGLYGDAFGECFHFFNVQQSFADASRMCGVIGGVLVSVHNAFEQSYILGNALKHFTDSDYWIGLSDLQQNGTWTWTDGAQSTYSNWGTGFPSGSGKDCAAAAIRGGAWYNTECSQKLKFACQVKPNSDYQDPNKFCAGNKKMFGKCYYYFDVALSNADSKTACGDLQGSLVAIHSQDEESYLLGVLTKRLSGDYWLGLHDPNDDGHWQWDDDGSSASFTNWESGFPIDGVTMDCTAAAIVNGKWYNAYCGQGTNRFICETAAEPLTTTVATTTARRTTAWSKDGWSYFNVTNSWYKFFLGSEDWDYGEENCGYEGGHLASIHSQAENDFIRGLAEPSMYMWIGLDCQSSPFNFTWSDGSPLDFLNWKTVTEMRYYYCVFMISDGRWENQRCNMWTSRVCKRPN